MHSENRRLVSFPSAAAVQYVFHKQMSVCTFCHGKHCKLPAKHQCESINVLSMLMLAFNIKHLIFPGMAVDTESCICVLSRTGNIVKIYIQKKDIHKNLNIFVILSLQGVEPEGFPLLLQSLKTDGPVRDMHSNQNKKLYGGKIIILFWFPDM